MVFDVAGPSYDGNMEEDPNPTTQHIYDLLKVSEQEIWKGNPHGHTQLSVVARLLNLKAEHHFSERLYDELCQFLSKIMPTDNIMIDSFYSTKKLMRGLGLPVEKIASIIPVAFRDLLPRNVWQPLTELSLFFKDLTSTIITEEHMRQLEGNVPLILNKLERIFPPSFRDSMEHLPIHLAYEARLAGPVQERWMYPCERKLRGVKNDIKNKNRVEALCGYYFESHISTRHKKVPQNFNDDGVEEDYPGMLSIFKHTGRGFGKKKKRRLDDKEYHAARTYILLNCDEVKPYIKIYEDTLRQIEPYIQDSEIDVKLETEFASWFNQYARDPLSGITNQFMKDLVEGPLHMVQPFNGYVVNGYKFHTEEYGSNKSTMNSGVCIKGSSHSADDIDYYGRLTDSAARVSCTTI